MGALHEGHLSLVRKAASENDEVLVTVFVNPTQFGPGEDFSRYPRDLKQDSALACSAGASLLFAPSSAEMYPDGEETRVLLPRISQGLCGDFRPGHFDGVATVVSKFFNALGEGTYYFGQKDYQQWRLIERLAQDLLFPVTVVGLPTVRDSDGLAMSSRNQFLSNEERQIALQVPRALQAALDIFRSGERRPSFFERKMAEVLIQRPVQLQYAQLRHAQHLTSLPDAFSEPAVAAIAVLVGKTRLIDNLVLASEAVDPIPSSSGGAK
jgi:pantoate--beta-alanine ligase